MPGRPSWSPMKPSTLAFRRICSSAAFWTTESENTGRSPEVSCSDARWFALKCFEHASRKLLDRLLRLFVRAAGGHHCGGVFCEHVRQITLRDVRTRIVPRLRAGDYEPHRDADVF